MQKLKVSYDPKPRTPRSTGCGEGIDYGQNTYYYIVGKRVPKDKVVSLSYEGCFCGRVHGEKEYIIVTWDGNDFVLLEHVYYEGVKKRLQRFRGLTPLEAIALVAEEERKHQEMLDAMPKCKICKTENSILIYDDQPRDVCTTCFKAGKHLDDKKPQ